MIEIFANNSDLRFVRLLKNQKTPFDKEWSKNPYKYSDILSHFNSGNNYGVACGYGDIVVIDCDKVTSQKDKNNRFPEYDQELSTIIEKYLPSTLTIESGSGGRHFYFKCAELKKKVVLNSKRNSEPLHFGEILSYGSQVVGPGSIHPNTGTKYKIINKSEIAKVKITDLYKVLTPFLTQVQDSYDNKTEHKIEDIPITDIFSTAGMKKTPEGYIGSHPVHGSTTGMNFFINPSKNLWHCFRCNSGGGPAQAIAVKEGIISCHQATRGGLRGNSFKEVLKVASDKYSLETPDFKVESFDQIQEKKSEELLKLWTIKDYEDYELDTNFLIDKVIYPKTITMLYSPPGQFKSFVAVNMALSIASGHDWLNYETKQNAVLYCDKENNDNIVKQRLMAMHKGLKIKDKDIPLYFLRREGDLIVNKRANDKFLQKLFKTIEYYNIKVVFFDTMHRFGDYEENSSDDVNLLYNHVFQRLLEEYGCSIIFLHHTNKDGNFRGSGDFLGMVDTAYKVKRKPKSDSFSIVNEKNRSGEIEQLNLDIEFYSKDDGTLNVVEISEVDLGEETKQNDYSAVTNLLDEGQLKMKKDFLAELQNNGVEMSESKLKRILAWHVEKGLFERDERNRYKLK